MLNWARRTLAYPRAWLLRRRAQKNATKGSW